MQARRYGRALTIVAATCMAVLADAPAANDPGPVIRLRCWLGHSLAICRDLARDRENRALEAVENETRRLRGPSPRERDGGSANRPPRAP